MRAHATDRALITTTVHPHVPMSAHVLSHKSTLEETQARGLSEAL
jgi:hypothetical protein